MFHSKTTPQEVLVALVNEVEVLVLICTRTRFTYTLPESTMDRDLAFVESLRSILTTMTELVLDDKSGRLSTEIHADVLGKFVSGSKELAKLLVKDPIATDKGELDELLGTIAELAVIIRGVLLGVPGYAEYRARN